MAKRRVLMTGAGGYVAAQLLPALAERYELVLVDVVGAADGAYGTIHRLDLARDKLENIAPYFDSVDVVVHNAYYCRKDLETSCSDHWREKREPLDPLGYEIERVNIDMAYRVLRIALEKKVQRVILTSSNHAADWYETRLHRGAMDVVDPMVLPLSDNFYGWAKASYELLGFIFASGRMGRKLETVAVRIGAPREIDGRQLRSDLDRFRRDLGAYVSPRDLRALYVRAIDAASIDDDDGIPFLIVYAISNNARAFWSIANARRILDYNPQDDSEARFAEDIRRYLTKT